MGNSCTSVFQNTHAWEQQEWNKRKKRTKTVSREAWVWKAAKRARKSPIGQSQPNQIIYLINITWFRRRLHCQLLANVMVKLYYSLVYSHLTYALLAWGRSGSTNGQDWVCCAHRRACKLLRDYNQKIITFHSIYDYFINISKTNYLLINHLICTIPDTE